MGGLNKAKLEEHSTEVIEAVIGRVFSLDRLRQLAKSFQPELGRTWDKYVLQQVCWGVQGELRRLRRESIGARSNEKLAREPAGAAPSNATALPPRVARKVDCLPLGQRAVWTLRCAPTFDPRHSDRNVMAEFSHNTRDYIDAEVLRLVGDVRARAFDREDSLDLTLKLAKLRRAIERREFARKSATAAGVSSRDLHALELTVEQEGWTAEQARTAWKDCPFFGESDKRKFGQQLEQFAVAAQKVHKLTQVVRASQEQLRNGPQHLVVDHEQIATTLRVTKSNSQKLFSRANAALGLRPAPQENEGLSAKT